MTSARPPVFVLGIGAQKCGSTWLHWRLNELEFTRMGALKEYHVFDTIFLEDFAEQRSKLPRKTQKYIKRHLEWGEPERSAEARSRFEFQKNQWRTFLDRPEEYFSYFRSLVSQSPDIRLTGDITPSYSLLPENAFRYIRTGLLDSGFSVKVVFGLRDPVDRLISMVRMRRRKRRERFPNHIEPRTLSEELAEALSLPTIFDRSRYDQTLDRIQSVFDETEIVLFLTEEIFSSESCIPLEQLCEDLDVPCLDPSRVEYDDRDDDQSEPEAVSAEFLRFARQEFQPVYQRVMGVFGHDRIEKAWNLNW